MNDKYSSQAIDILKTDPEALSHDSSGSITKVYTKNKTCSYFIAREIEIFGEEMPKNVLWDQVVVQW